MVTGFKEAVLRVEVQVWWQGIHRGKMSGGVDEIIGTRRKRDLSRTELFPLNSYAEAFASSTSKCDYLESPLKVVIKVKRGHMAGPNPIGLVSLWDQHTNNTEPQGLPCGDAVRRQSSPSQAGRPQEKPTLLTPWSRTCSLQAVRQYTYDVSAAQPVVRHYSSPSKVIQDLRTKYGGTLTFKGKLEGDAANGDGEKEEGVGPWQEGWNISTGRAVDNVTCCQDNQRPSLG